METCCLHSGGSTAVPPCTTHIEYTRSSSHRHDVILTKARPHGVPAASLGGPTAVPHAQPIKSSNVPHWGFSDLQTTARLEAKEPNLTAKYTIRGPAQYKPSISTNGWPWPTGHAPSTHTNTGSIKQQCPPLGFQRSAINSMT